MKQSLQLKMGQTLAMTPQLQQAIRMLQLSTLELQQEIQQALDENPLLEQAEEESIAEAPDNVEERDEVSETAVDTLMTDEASLSDNESLDTRWEESFVSGGAGLDGLPDIETRSTASVSLQQYLIDQMWELSLDVDEQVMFIALVDSIDDQGYLRGDPNELVHAASEEAGKTFDMDCFESTLFKLHQCDPPGVGARDIQECLALQLDRLSTDVDARECALELINDRFDALAKRDMKALGRGLDYDSETLSEAISLIKSLSPRPGTVIGNHEADYVIPDLVVRKRGDVWRVELNPEAVPRLALNKTYSDLVEVADKDGKEYIKAQTREAKWLIRSVESRFDTLLKVGRTIMAEQIEFLESGEEHMKPLILADIATQIEMHESTISRATTQKFILTPRGLYELKYFFSSQVAGQTGDAASSTAIRAIMKRLIQAETPSKPLSDNKLAQLLEQEGIKVARRTVAKYREAMGIAGSSERKQLG